MAIVVMADIAIYEPESMAECTGGAGAVALLVGPNAPLVLEKPLISTHMSDAFDFYKPVCGSSCEFPRVDGKNSLDCYLGALEVCYNEFRRRFKKYLKQGKNYGMIKIIHLAKVFTKNKTFAR
jgi:hydroxymethylglutaryl-CoA synthase